MKLLLTTLHSRYIHSSLALPCLAASCAHIEGVEIVIREMSINERTADILESLAREQADIIAFSCYIWNIDLTMRIAAELKLIYPGIYIILGGPEVSYATHQLMVDNPQIDAVISGEGESALPGLLAALSKNNGAAVSDERLMECDSLTFRSGNELLTTRKAPLIGDLDSIPSPFAAGLADLSKPLVYFESSRGCPFSCSFCLSSAEQGVRTFSLPRAKSDLALLMTGKAGTVKFVDRTFNCDAARAGALWAFILENNITSRFHFEIAADLLTDENFAILKKVPEETFRFEIGLQSSSSATLASVERRSDLDRVATNIKRLKAETAVTVHLDLVAGLPGEDFAGFSRSLTTALDLAPDHLQIEPLKMLKGTRLRKDADKLGYRYSPAPPYKILRSASLEFSEICRIEEIAERVEHFYNSGRFKAAMGIMAELGILAGALATASDGKKWGTSGGSHLGGCNELLKLVTEYAPQHLESVRDALSYDFCLSGYPGTMLPENLQNRTTSGFTNITSLEVHEINSRLNLPKGSRFRTCTAAFLRDYSREPAGEDSCYVTFVYPGGAEGKRVMPLKHLNL